MEQSSAELTTAVAREDEPLLERKYRLFLDWHLNATGEIPFSKASPELMPYPEGYAGVSIQKPVALFTTAVPSGARQDLRSQLRFGAPRAFLCAGSTSPEEKSTQSEQKIHCVPERAN